MPLLQPPASWRPLQTQPVSRLRPSLASGWPMGQATGFGGTESFTSWSSTVESEIRRSGAGGFRAMSGSFSTEVLLSVRGVGVISELAWATCLRLRWQSRHAQQSPRATSSRRGTSSQPHSAPPGTDDHHGPPAAVLLRAKSPLAVAGPMPQCSEGTGLGALFRLSTTRSCSEGSPSPRGSAGSGAAKMPAEVAGLPWPLLAAPSAADVVGRRGAPSPRGGGFFGLTELPSAAATGACGAGGTGLLNCGAAPSGRLGLPARLRNAWSAAGSSHTPCSSSMVLVAHFGDEG
mmetsp:Transcript_84046/g.216354  ORF Transcript_84046/g.216354 Transcript_84046/m.216354 type:complete len:290 (-) Transcript_84046:747-1616(-)